MSFSALVSDIAFRDKDKDEQRSVMSQGSRTASYARSVTSTTSASIAGDIRSQLHGGYGHPLTRSWQAERQLTKVRWTDEAA
jgi:porphobilinogen synthase